MMLITPSRRIPPSSTSQDLSSSLDSQDAERSTDFPTATQEPKACGATVSAVHNKLPMPETLKGYVVMLHHQEVGTFAPSFRTMDEAEEFSNAMRLVTTNVAVSEPVPVVSTRGLIQEDASTPHDPSGLDWDQKFKQHINCPSAAMLNLLYDNSPQ